MAEELIVGVDGMSCQHCVDSIEGGLSKLEGIESVSVRLDKKDVVLKVAQLTETLTQAIRTAIEDLGYDPRPA